MDPQGRATTWDELGWTGDVKYHMGAYRSPRRDQRVDMLIHMPPNPSHLEAVNPVVEGRARAQQTDRSTAVVKVDPDSTLPILIHGDAAFAAQGVVAETFNMARLAGYSTGGTVHLIANNQVGFTTGPDEGRSTVYSSDLAKGFDVPIIHVNADDAEASLAAARLAMMYRQRFHADVVIDLVGYRRYGHNEGDDPSYTQPLMYAKINERRSVRKLFTESLVKRGQLSLDEAEQALDDFQKRLQQALDETRQPAPPANHRAAEPAPAAGVVPHVETGVDRSVLDRVFGALTAWPDDFNVHPKLARQMDARDKVFHESGEVDFATA